MDRAIRNVILIGPNNRFTLGWAMNSHTYKHFIKSLKKTPLYWIVYVTKVFTITNFGKIQSCENMNIQTDIEPNWLKYVILFYY